MAKILIIITAILYLGTGIDFLIKYNWQMAMVFISYATANVGLYFASGV